MPAWSRLRRRTRRLAIANEICSGLLSTSLEQTNNADELTTKFDFNLSAKDKVSATIGANRTLFLNPFPYATVPGFPSRTTADYYFTNIGYTRIFSPTLLNEFHFVTHRSNYLQDSVTKQLPTGSSLGVEHYAGPCNRPDQHILRHGLSIWPQ